MLLADIYYICKILIFQHTFKASMAYSPIAFQLDCGYFSETKQVLGNWCPKCGGVTAMYKEDWVQILSSHDGMYSEKCTS